MGPNFTTLAIVNLLGLSHGYSLLFNAVVHKIGVLFVKVVISLSPGTLYRDKIHITTGSFLLTSKVVSWDVVVALVDSEDAFGGHFCLSQVFDPRNLSLLSSISYLVRLRF